MPTAESTSSKAEGQEMIEQLMSGSDEKCLVPQEVAICPECGGLLRAEAFEWETETGRPTDCGLLIGCTRVDEKPHKFWQSDWQPVRNVVINEILGAKVTAPSSDQSQPHYDQCAPTVQQI
jgi:hypothetical protein